MNELVPVVYDELHRIAELHLRKERSNHSLQPTALINEAYLQLARSRKLALRDRTHFFALAARIMRHVLINHAHARNAAKRGGAVRKVTLREAVLLPERKECDVLELDQALQTLASMDERKSQIVELHFFAGLTNEEVAEVLGISLATVNREWRMARAWLSCKLKK